VLHLTTEPGVDTRSAAWVSRQSHEHTPKVAGCNLLSNAVTFTPRGGLGLGLAVAR